MLIFLDWNKGGSNNFQQIKLFLSQNSKHSQFMLYILAESEYQQASAVPLQTDKPNGYSGAPT